MATTDKAMSIVTAAVLVTVACAHHIPTSGNETDTSSDTTVPCGIFFFIIYGPLYGLVCAFGLIGNSLSFAVLHKYTCGNVGTYLLKALALMDNLFLATAAGVQMYLAMAMYFDLSTQLEPIYPAFQTYAWPLTHIIQMCTVWMMVLVAGNRYVAVCRPLEAPRLCTKHNVQLEIAIMASAVVVFNIPRFFEYRYVTENVTEIDTNNVTVSHEESVNVGLTSLRIYNILYENISYCLFVFLLPLLILIFFNVHLMHDLKVARRCRKAMTSRSSNDENNITLVMIIIIIVFIVCQTPATINQILFYIVHDMQASTCTPYKQYYHVSNLLITMNSSLNFVIYCLFRRQFQHQLWMLFGRRRCAPPGTARNYFTQTEHLAMHVRGSYLRGSVNRNTTVLRSDNSSDCYTSHVHSSNNSANGNFV